MLNLVIGEYLLFWVFSRKYAYLDSKFGFLKSIPVYYYFSYLGEHLSTEKVCFPSFFTC